MNIVHITTECNMRVTAVDLSAVNKIDIMYSIAISFLDMAHASKKAGAKKIICIKQINDGKF